MNVKLNTTNRFPGRCCNCGREVAAQRGYLLRGDQVDDPKLAGKKWLTLCNTVQCVAAVVGEEAVADADRRALLADGTIEMPADEETKALRRAMGSWDGERRKWIASPLYRDRDHVLTIAAQLGLDVAPEFSAYEDPEPVRAAVARARAIPTIREYQVAGVRWLAYRGLLDGAPEGYKDNKPGGLLADGMGVGKQQPVDTKVMTPQGWREIGSLRIGDYVTGSAGTPTRVTGIFPQGVKPSYRVWFTDGASVEAGPEHLWALEYLRGGRVRDTLIATTDQIRTGATITRKWPNGRSTSVDLSKTLPYVPVLSGPVQFAEYPDLPIAPYTLGALIANGGLSHGSAALTVAAEDQAELHEFITSEGSEIRRWRNPVPSVATTIICGALQAVRDLGLAVLSGAKFIPEIYKRARPAERLALLHGLMDGDGSITPTKNKVYYHTTSARLAYDVQELVECLGGVAQVRAYDRSHHGKPTDYAVRVRMPEGVAPFRISRKRNCYNPVRKLRPVRRIDRVEYVRDVESVCISVAAEDHLYVTEHAILTHNTVQVLLSLHDDEALVVVCPANAKAVWPREAAKWRPDRFDKVTVCDGEESFRWPESTRELVVINYDVLPSTPSQIVDEKAALLAERHGAKPNPDGKTKAEREGQRGLLPQIIDLADDYSDLAHHDGGLTSADRHLVYQLLCGWVTLSDKLHKNRRALNLNARRVPAGKPACPVLLVFDEAHYAENNKAQRTERCRYLAGKARRIYGLTGTPVDSEPLKLWGLMQTIRATPFTWSVFRECFSAFDGQWGGIDFLRHPPAPGSTARGPVIVQPGTTEILRRSMLRRTKDDPKIAAELPPKIFSEIPITLDEKLVRECDEITSTYADVLLRGELPPFEAMAGVRKAIAAACVPAMQEIVAEYEDAGTPLLVFSAHTGPIKALGKRAGWFTITGEVDSRTRGTIEDRFQAGQGHGVGGTQAMCEAMTLTRASTVLQVDPFWKKSQNEQAYDRAHRIGQRDTVHVIRLVPDHVLVRHTADLLCGKDRFVSDVLTGEIKVDAPPSRFVRADEAEWNAAREAKAAEDRAADEAAERKRQAAVERDLREAMQRDAERITPKLSEARAKARHERLAAEQHEDDAAARYADTPKAVVQEAFAFMQSVCDGAVQRDGDGFNKPDSCVAQWLAPGVAAGTKHATAAAASILRHYPRQLAERWPELFKASR